jgi:WD40 repeat protein
VVTGQPGAGKSAVVARAALDLETSAVAAAGPWPVGVWFHARYGVLADLVAAVVALVGGGMAESVAGLVERVRDCPILVRIVVDALDEAASDRDRADMVQTLVDLAALPQSRIVVATRALATGNRFASGTLLNRLGLSSVADNGLVDLDTDAYHDPTGLIEFAAALLRQDDAAQPVPPDGAWSVYRSDSSWCQRLSAAVAARAGRNYLVAALTADPLAHMITTVDPAASGFDPATLPASVGEALTKYLDQQPARERAHVRGLLSALAYARGSGLTDSQWLAFADALGYRADTVDLDTLRSTSAADYLLQSTRAQGAALTRLFHQALADELLDGRPARAHDELRLLTAVLPATEQTWYTASDYARSFAADHAAAAGRLDDLLADPVYPSVANLDRLIPLLPPVASSTMAPVVAVLRTAAHRARSLSPDRRNRLYRLTAAHLGLSAGVVGHADVVSCRWAHTNGPPHQTLAGHVRPVWAVAIGWLGYRDVIVSASIDRTVRTWDAATGHSIGDPLTHHRGAVWAVALGRIGKRDVIITGGHDQTVWIVDAATGHVVDQPLAGHTDAVRAVTWGRVGNRDVIVIGSGWSVRMWDARTRQPLGGPLVQHSGRVWAVALGRVGDRHVVVAGGDKGTIRRWDARTGDPVGDPLAGHTDRVRAVILGRIGGREVIVSGGDDATVRVWDAGSGESVRAPLVGHSGRVWAAALGRIADREVIVSGGDDATVRIWDAATGDPVGDPLVGHTGRVLAVASGRIGNRDVVISGGADRTVRVFDAAVEARMGEPRTGHMRRVWTVAHGWIGEREVVISGGADRTIRIFDAADGHPVGRPIACAGDAESVALGRVGSQDLIVCGSSDHTVQIFDAVTGGPLCDRLVGHTGPVWAVALGQVAGRDVIVSGSGDSTVRIWDAITREAIGVPLAGHGDWVAAVALGYNGEREVIISGGGDQTVRIWDAVSGQPVGQPLRGHTDWVRAVATGRIGNRDVIISGGDDQTVRIWDARSGQPIGDPLVGHTHWIFAVGLVRTGSRELVISGSDDQTVRIWDAVTGTPVATQDTFEPVAAIVATSTRLAVAAGRAICLFTFERDHVPDRGASYSPSTTHISPRVFVSYSHETPEHKESVLQLCALLTERGVDVRVDQNDVNERRIWTDWTNSEILGSDFVIVVASPAYRAAGENRLTPGKNLGVRSEYLRLADLLHRDPALWTRKILPVVLPGREVDEIPLVFLPGTADHYVIDRLTPDGVVELLQVLQRGRGSDPQPPTISI